MQGGLVHRSITFRPRSNPRPGFLLEARETKIAGAAMLAAGATMNAINLHTPPVCPLLNATGIPCPLCGMTTGVRATLRGDLTAALSAAPAAVALVAGVLILLVSKRAKPIAIPKIAMFGSLALMWVFQLFRFGVL